MAKKKDIFEVNIEQGGDRFGGGTEKNFRSLSLALKYVRRMLKYDDVHVSIVKNPEY